MRSILVASDPSGVGEEGLRTAAAVAARTGAALHALHGVAAIGLGLREAAPHLEPGAHARVQARLDNHVRGACAAYGVVPEGCHVSYHETLEALPARARAMDADLVVVSAAYLRRSGAMAALGRAQRTAGCPVLIARGTPSFRTVLVPVSESDLEANTLRRACEWVTPLQESEHPRSRAEIHVLHVAPGLRRWRDAGASLAEAVREAEGLMWGKGRLHEHVRWAEAAAERIVESAHTEEADLIILGPPRRGAREEAAPRTWEAVSAQARCSVLLMPAGEKAGREEGVLQEWPLHLQPLPAS